MRALAAFAVCLLAGLALYPAAVSLLVARRVGQRVSTFTPGGHIVKMGTPTMGGALFCLLAAVAVLVLDRSHVAFVAVFAIVGGGLVGALDDLTNVRGRLALGLLGRQKLVLQALVGLFAGIGLHAAGVTAELVPGLGAPDLGWGIVPVAVLAVVAVSNAVNLTDGVDGLAGSCAVIGLATLWALAAHAGDRPVAVGAAALCGGVLAFLVYNWWPARVFMGDTGALAMGAGLAVLAAELRVLWLVPLLGVVFMVETLSVIVNVTAIRRFGRRVLLASPLHHHLEQKGLREQAVVLVLAALGAAGALLTAAVALKAGLSPS